MHNHTQFRLADCRFAKENGIVAKVVIEAEDRTRQDVEASGSGRLDAVNHCIMQHFGLDYQLSTYEEHALGEGADAKAVSYVSINAGERVYWGVGIHTDIIQSSIDALVSAVNRLLTGLRVSGQQDERIGQILAYIRKNYRTVTLDDISREFYLSKPYLSRYIRDKSGMTFGSNVQKIRLGKATSMLRSGNMKVERIAEQVGYPNVEHFNRLFKKTYGCTPVQYRESAGDGEDVAR